jgi:subtilase family serine protease
MDEKRVVLPPRHRNGMIKPTERHRLALALRLALVLGVLAGLAALRERPALAQPADDSGRADAIAQLSAPLAPARELAITIMLKRRNQSALEDLIKAQQDPASPSYHQWLTPADFAARFGPADDQLERVTGWLTANGFTVDSIALGNRLIRAHAAAAAAAAALDVKFAASPDGHLFANLNDPYLPAAVASLIEWVGGLDNLKAKVTYAHVTAPKPRVDINDGGNAFGPPDIYSFYDESPLLDADPVIDGSNTDCVAVIEDSGIDQASTDVFNTQFNLPAFDYSLSSGTNFQTVFADSSDPGINSDQIEALLDLEYVHALAPGANIINYIGDNQRASLTGLGFLDAAYDAIDQNRCGTISISYGICGASAGFVKEVDSVFEQGAAQGQSIFIASGDEGAAALKFSPKQDTCVVAKQRGVEPLESSPHVTSVGGTMFTPDYNDDGDNVGRVAESVWNDSSGAGSGGRGTIFKKPAYQKGVTPKDNSRDVPDIAFGASPISPGFYFGYSNPNGDSSSVQCCIGGTSVGAPSWAGISMLIQQELGARSGLFNTKLYQLGPSEASAGIHDVTAGNNSYNGVKGFAAVRGYDQASGWGTPDIADFVAAFIAP